VEEGRVAGVVDIIYRRGQEAHVDVIGWQDEENQVPLARDTIFRLASMSKPIASVATLMLVEEGKLRLDDPVDAWLPELANPQVLKNPQGPLDETFPSPRPITTRDLLTHRSGIAGSGAPGPLGEARRAANLRQYEPDEWMRRVGEFPLAYAPGTRWHYGTSSDVLGVLIARVSGMSFPEFLRTRLFEPLSMKDSGFWVPEENLDRLSVLYAPDRQTGKRVITDHPSDSRWARPPAFPSGAAGMVSTADDYLRFARMLLNGGELDGARILSRKSVELMTTDHLTPEQRAADYGGQRQFSYQGFGLGVYVVDDLSQAPTGNSLGKFGWGGAHSTWYFVDPAENMAAVMMSQLTLMADAQIFRDFDTMVYQAIDD
jgi:CubicO group peptidase (beta-lactamase class C family)